MPRHCCIPGCKANYATTLKENNNAVVSTFIFPKEKEKLHKWLKAIPRENWTPTKSSVVCAKHFCDSEIIRYEEFSLSSGELKRLPLKHPKLSESAIPHIFPDLPKYLSFKQNKTRKNPEDRREAFRQQYVKEVDNFLHEDLISDFNDLKANFHTKICLFSWEVKVMENKFFFYLLNIDKCLSVNSTVIVDTDLHVKIFLKETELSPNKLKWVLPWDLKLQRWSQLENILSHYKANNVNSEELFTIQDLLRRGLELLSKAYSKCDEDDNFLHSTHLELLIDQLTQIVSNKNKYRPATIIMSFVIYSQSPACYNLIRDFFVLPHKRYLQSISSSLSVSPKDEENNKNYLLNICKNLTESEKVVSLLIDEIYVSSRMDYRAQSLVGSAENTSSKSDCQFAKTIATFMISSAFGNMSEVVKLWPVNNVTGIELTQKTKQILNFIQDCGFEVLCIITDNHSINSIMFKQLSDNGMWFSNPKDHNKIIFLLFDFVHIFKNIWKNWLNLKNIDNTFVFCDFETTTLKYAKFQVIKNVYESEKDHITKQAYKLNFKSLYPSSLERQKVHLADNVFHESTIACLKTIPDCKDTADFLQIIRQWWDIVNNRNFLKGTLKRNDWCKPFTDDSDCRLTFLESFVNWLDKWDKIENNNGHLSKQTFHAIKQSTVVLIEIIKYSFKNFSIKYLLPGKFTSENLEKRFGIYRLLSGSNYNVSADDVINAEKKIRIKHIFKNINPCFTLNDIKLQFSMLSESDIQESCDMDEVLLQKFIFILKTDYLKVSLIDESSKIYITGYASHVISKKLNGCQNCISLITVAKGQKTSNEYFDNLQRNGLSIATDRVGYIFFHMTSILQFIMQNKDIDKLFIQSNQQKKILCILTTKSVQSDFYYFDFLQTCLNCRQNQISLFNKICSVFSNILLNNYVKIKNNTIFELQKKKKYNEKRSLECEENNSQKKRKLMTFK